MSRVCEGSLCLSSIHSLCERSSPPRVLWEPRVKGNRLVTIEIVLQIDPDLADALEGDYGWMGSDGSSFPPISGQVLRADGLVWDLARQAHDTWRDSLGAIIVSASARFEDLKDEDIYPI